MLQFSFIAEVAIAVREAASILLEMGYSDIVDIGGIQDWPYDVVGTEVN